MPRLKMLRFSVSKTGSGGNRHISVLPVDNNEPFLPKLWQILQDEPRELIHYKEDGASFIIPDLQEVEKHILTIF